MRALIGLGSNLGDRQRNLEQAIERLRNLPETECLRASHLYATRPWGVLDQPEFLNAVAEIETRMKPHRLLRSLQGIEQDFGRTRSERWGPRILDLDLLDCDGQIVQDDRLCLPHPRIAQRAFVLVPLCEIAPDWKEPLTGRTSIEMLDELDPDPDEVRVAGRFSAREEEGGGDAVGSDLLGD
jgi:2-amino-4-hydroxy-6-hydroxymethyldihydropteridine diphosphokinase